jgi:prevent-host-death family protein
LHTHRPTPKLVQPKRTRPTDSFGEQQGGDGEPYRQRAWVPTRTLRRKCVADPRPTEVTARKLLHRFLYSFAVTIFADAENVAITEASRRGVSKLVADAEAGHPTVLRRRSEPVAALVGYKDVQRLAAMERDLTDVALVLTRAATDNGRRTPLDDVITSLGFTREQLDKLDDPA